MSNFSTLFEPNYTILTFLMIKTFFYIELIGVLAMLRAFVAKGPSRWMAMLSFLVALIGVGAKYIPPLAGLTGTDAGRIAAQIVNAGLLNAGSGMMLPLATSALLALSWYLPGRRWWGLDLVHFSAAVIFFGLWVYTAQ